MRKPCEVSARLFPAPADDGNFQTPTNDLGNFSEGHTLFGYGMVVRSMICIVQSKLENPGRIESVHCRPPICLGVKVDRSVLVARYLNEYWNEAMVTIAAN